MKRFYLFSISFLLCLVFIHHPSVFAGTTWSQDAFNSNTPTTTSGGKTVDANEDTANSKALVTLAPDTTNGNVSIQDNALPNDFQLVDQTDYVVGTQSGIDWVAYNQSTGSMQQVTAYSVPNVMPLAFAVDPNTQSIYTYDKNTNSIREFVFNGSSMQENTVAQVTTGSPVYSMSYDPNSKILFTETKNSSGTRSVTGYTTNSSGGLTAIPWLDQVDLGHQGGIGVSAVQSSPAFIESTSSGSYYYAFNNSTNTYQDVPTMNVTFGGNAIGFGSNQGVSQIFMTNSSINGYAFNSSTSQYQTTNIYALDASFPSNVNAISMLQGNNAYDYGILTKNGTIHYYTFNQSTGKMQEVNYLDSSGYSIVQGMDASAQYQTVALNAPSGTFEEFQLQTEEDIPSDTSGSASIDWYYSVDGTTWTPLTLAQTSTSTISSYKPGTTTSNTYSDGVYTGNWVTLASPSSKVYLRAVLNATPDQSNTPMIFGYTLYGANVGFVPGTFQVTKVVTSNSQFDGNLSSFPLSLYEGDQITYQIETTGNAQLQANYNYSDGSVVTVPPLSAPNENMVSTTPISSAGSSDTQLWTVTVTLPSVTQAKSMYAVLNATKGTYSASFTQNPFVSIGNTYGTNVYTYLTS